MQTSDLPRELLGLPVLTVLPPWGTAIARWGKGYENRGRPPPASYKGKRLGIHQGQLGTYPDGRLRSDERARAVSSAIAGLISEGLIPTPKDNRVDEIMRARAQVVADAGRLLAIATVADALEVDHDHAVSLWETPGRHVELDPWMIPGQVAWRLTDLEPLTEPILLSGLQGIWRLTHERRLAALQAQEKRATR